MVPAGWARRSLSRGKELKDPLQVGVDGGLGLFAVAAVGPQFQVLRHGHGREKLAAFGDLGEPQPDDHLRGQARKRLPGEGQVAVLPHQSADGVEQGGLAGAVGPDQRDDLALPDAHSHAAQCPDRAVIGG